MSVISDFAQRVLFKLGWIAIFAGCAIIGGESYAGLSFTAATARVTGIIQKCGLVDATGRGIKYVGDGTCAEMEDMKAEMAPRQLELRPYRAVNVSFNDKNGQEVTSTAHLAGLGVQNPKAGDSVAILYNPSHPAIVRGPANIPAFAYIALLAGIVMQFMRRQLAQPASSAPRSNPAARISNSAPVHAPQHRMPVSATAGGFGRRSR